MNPAKTIKSTSRVLYLTILFLILSFFAFNQLKVADLNQGLDILYYLPSGKLATNPGDQTQFEAHIEGIRYLGKTGNLIDNAIYFAGGFELYLLHFLKDSIQLTTGSKGVFLDIGANTGQHSLYMSQYASFVHAIEPFPPVLKRMRDMVKLNEINNIKIHSIGYSNENNILPFYTPSPVNLGTGSFDPNIQKNYSNIINLPLVVGDNHLKSEEINRIDLIKIDIEGYERYALMGLKETLKNNRPIVVLELNATEGGFQTKESFFETFPVNYDFFQLTPKGATHSMMWQYFINSYAYSFGPMLVTDYTLDKFDYSFDGQKDIVAIPKEKRSFFKKNKV